MKQIVAAKSKLLITKSMASRRKPSFVAWMNSLATVIRADYADLTEEDATLPEFASQAELDSYIANLESDMREAAKKFEFEKAANLRDTVKELRTKEFLFG